MTHPLDPETFSIFKKISAPPGKYVADDMLMGHTVVAFFRNDSDKIVEEATFFVPKLAAIFADKKSSEQLLVEALQIFMALQSHAHELTPAVLNLAVKADSRTVRIYAVESWKYTSPNVDDRAKQTPQTLLTSDYWRVRKGALEAFQRMDLMNEITPEQRKKLKNDPVSLMSESAKKILK